MWEGDIAQLNQKVYNSTFQAKYVYRALIGLNLR